MKREDRPYIAGIVTGCIVLTIAMIGSAVTACQGGATKGTATWDIQAQQRSAEQTPSPPQSP